MVSFTVCNTHNNRECCTFVGSGWECRALCLPCLVSVPGWSAGSDILSQSQILRPLDWTFPTLLPYFSRCLHMSKPGKILYHHPLRGKRQRTYNLLPSRVQTRKKRHFFCSSNSDPTLLCPRKEKCSAHLARKAVRRSQIASLVLTAISRHVHHTRQLRAHKQANPRFGRGGRGYA